MFQLLSQRPTPRTMSSRSRRRSPADRAPSAATIAADTEVGAWALEYIGPGFHVQLRVARRNRQARLDGWMTPGRAGRVLLTTHDRRASVLEADITPSGRFSFPDVPTGPCRMTFILGDGPAPATPPFWI